MGSRHVRAAPWHYLPDKRSKDWQAAGYREGQVDFLQLIDNWRQLLKFQLTEQRLMSQLRQTLASLERVVGGFNAYEEAIGGNAMAVEFIQPAQPQDDPPLAVPEPPQLQ